LVAALSLAACGRKAGLDAPPSSYVSPTPQTSESAPTFVPALTGSQQSPAQGQAAPTSPPPRTFFLDPLIN